MDIKDFVMLRNLQAIFALSGKFGRNRCPECVTYVVLLSDKTTIEQFAISV